MMQVLLKRRNLEAQWPYRKHIDDAGHDLVCCEDTWIWPFTAKDIDTGWDIKVPDGTWGNIKSRSSTFICRWLLVLDSVLDPNYTGVLSVVIFNPTFLPRRIRKGDRLAQLLIAPVVETEFKSVTTMPSTGRGLKGFGSTGRGFKDAK